MHVGLAYAARSGQDGRRGREVGLTVFGFPFFNVARWAATAVRLLARSVPAAVVAIFAGLILLVGLFLSERRQEYALTAAKYAGGLVKDLLGPASLANISTDLSREDVVGSSPGGRPDAGVLVVVEPTAENGAALE